MIFSPERNMKDYNPTTQPWFVKATENKGQAIISEPFLSVTSNKIAVSPADSTKDGSGIVGAIEMSEIQEASIGILYTTMVVMAIAVIIGIMLALWIVRSITTPLKKLIHTTESIAGGNLTEEISGQFANDSIRGRFQ
jgi:methyl-accepting chemotaxis protein